MNAGGWQPRRTCVASSACKRFCNVKPRPCSQHCSEHQQEDVLDALPWLSTMPHLRELNTPVLPLDLDLHSRSRSSFHKPCSAAVPPACLPDDPIIFRYSSAFFDKHSLERHANSKLHRILSLNSSISGSHLKGVDTSGGSTCAEHKNQLAQRAVKLSNAWLASGQAAL